MICIRSRVWFIYWGMTCGCGSMVPEATKLRPMRLSMEGEVEQLKSLVEDLFMKVESLENRISVLEDESSAKPTGPEPIQTCVQCLSEYKESENAEGHCKYHTARLSFPNRIFTYTCCNATARDHESAKTVPGCVKGKHRSKHHTDYEYASYFFHMGELSNNAKEIWLQMDIMDLVTDDCAWGEVGVSSKGNVFLLIGHSRIEPLVYVEFTTAELQKFKKSQTVLEKKDPIGRILKAELHSDGSMANAITVSLKPASYTVPLEKRINLIYTDNSFRPGAIQYITDPVTSNCKVSYAKPSSKVVKGPSLEPGEDYSVDRKTDYISETSDDMFAIELRQIGGTLVNSSYRMKNGNWNNLFTTSVKIINGSPNIVSFTDVYGEYTNKDGVWTKCNNLWVGPTESDFLEIKDFLVDCAAPMSIVVRVAIEMDGPEPGNWAERSRAHHSLPQPLNLRVTFVDLEKRTVSLRFEQGNPPLDIPTYEKRMKSWGKNQPLLFYLFADDVTARKRSDAAMYYDDNGMLVFRPAPNEQGSTSFYLKDIDLMKIAFQAKKHPRAELELTRMKKENNGSSVQMFALVDLDRQIAYGVKVVITTRTSSATDYFVLPRDNFTSAKLTLALTEDVSESTTESMQVLAHSNFYAKWSLPRACKNDRIEIFAQYGGDSVSGVTNRKGTSEGQLQLKAPSLPGLYEVRYYPSWLFGTYTGLRHKLFVAMDSFEVTSA